MRCPFSLARFSLSRAFDEVSIARSSLADELPKRCDFGAPRVRGMHVKRDGVHERGAGGAGRRRAHVKRERCTFAVRSLVSS